MADPKRLKKTGDHRSNEILLGIALHEKETAIVGGSAFVPFLFDFAAKKPAAKPLAGKHESYVTAIVNTAGGFVSAGYDGKLIWWDAGKAKPTRTIDAHTKWIRELAVSPDRKTIASVADDMDCHLWDAKTGKKLRTLQGHAKETPNHYPSMLFAVAFNADGKKLVTADKVGNLVLWETTTGDKIKELKSPGMYTWDPRARRHSIGGCRSAAFSPDGKTLAAGGIGKIGNVDHLGGPARVELFDLETGKSLRVLEDKKLKGLVEQINFSPDGKWFLTAGGDHNGFLTIYETKTGKLIKQEKAPGHVHSVAINDDFSKLYAAGHQRLTAWSM